MAQYRLTAPALRDLEQIIVYLIENASVEIADRMERKLFEA